MQRVEGWDRCLFITGRIQYSPIPPPLSSCVRCVAQVFWHALWTLDDVLFPAYRSEDLTGSVFIVGTWLASKQSSHLVAIVVHGVG